MSRRTSKEEEEKRKREQEQGARRRQTNQGSTGTKSSAVSQTATQKQAQANAQQARNRKSTDTRANAGKTTTLAKAKQAAETAAATQARNRKSTDTRANSGKSAAQTAKPKNTGTQATGSAANRKSTDTRANSGNTASGKPILRTMGRTAAKKAAEKVTSTDKGKQALETEKRMMGILDQARKDQNRSVFINDVAARMGSQLDSIARGTYFSPYTTGALERAGLKKYYEPGRTENNPNTPAGMVKSTLPAPQLDRFFLHQELKDNNYGLGKTKLDPAALLAATSLAPLDAMKADARTKANYFGRAVGARSKAWDSGLTDREKVKAGIGRLSDQMRQDRRQRSAANQTLSRYDKKLREQFQDEIKLAKADYNSAKARGDTAGMQAAHKRAETWRRIEGGYSGGATGMEHITPKLEQSDISTLNKTGQTQLRAAKLGYENAQTDQERSRYAAMGQDIRRNPAYLKETYDRGAYRETDANGRMRYAGTAEERAKEAEQGAAIPKAIGTGIAGAFLSLPGTTARALQTDAARNQAALQRLSDIRGGGEVRVSAPAPLTEETLGQRLLRRSDEYREKATEGQTGLNRYLTEALITGGEMIPGLAATALTGGMAAPGLAVMGAQAAGRRMGDLERQGEDPVRAFNRGLATGLIEAATERVPLGNLTKIAKGGGKSFARNMLTQALEEVGTEELSEIGNYAADKAFGDPNASLTAQDLKDTAVISLLTSLGMGAGAGIVGGRRTGQAGRQTTARTTDQTGTRSGPVRQESAAQTEDSIQAREAQLQAREKALDARAQEALEQMARSTDSDTYYNHFRNKLAQVRQEQAQVRQERARLAETRRQAEISREEAQTRRAEEERIAEESRYQPGRARDAGAELAAGQLSRVNSQAQAARNRLAGEEVPVLTAMRDAIRGAVGQDTARGRQGEITPLAPLNVPQRARERAQEPEGSRATSARYGRAENHIDNRVSQDMSDRRVKAFQWDQPEVKPYFRRAAAALKQQAEYADSTKTAQRASAIQQARGKRAGTVMAKNEPIRQLMDRGLSTTDIIRACDAIIHDQGQENYAAAKRVELALDDMLSNGYRPIEAAGWEAEDFVSPNTDYLQVKETLPGAVARGSFEEYLRHNAIALETGEVTEEQLRQEWEEDRRIREDRESLYRAADGWGQNPRRYRTMEDELAAHAERVSEWMDEPEMQDAPEEYWRRYWQQAREEEQRIREKWAGRETAPRLREYVDPETGELVREERTPAAEAEAVPALAETVREEGQKNTPRGAEEVVTQQKPAEQAERPHHPKGTDFDDLVVQLRDNLQDLVNMEPVSVVTGKEVPTEGRATERALSFLRKIGMSVFRPGFGEVLFSKSKIKSSFVGHGVGNTKVELIAGVPDVIAKGDQIGFEPNWKGRGYDSYVFAGPVMYKGAPVYIGAIVNKYGQGNRYYLHEVVDQDGNIIYGEEKEPEGIFRQESPEGLNTVIPSDSDNSIPQTEAERNGKVDEEAENVSDQDPYSVGAAPGGFDPYSHMQNEYGTIEPGENPARMVDVPVSTNGEDRVRRGVRTIMEAQITPDEAIQAFEDEVVKGTFSYHPRKDKASVEAAVQTLEDKGYWGAMEQWNDVTEGRRAAGKDDIVLAQFLYAEAARAKNIDTMRKLAAEIAAEATAAGQQVQAMRLLKKATPEGKVYYIHRLVSKMQAELEEGRGDKAPTLTIDPALEERLLDAEDEESQQEVIDEIYDQVAEQLPKTFADRLNAWRYFAMLGNPRTHIRNIVGNVLVQVPLQTANKASALAQAATLPQEKRTRAVIASRAAKQFARADYQQMKNVLSDGDKYSSDESQIRRRQKLFPTPVQALMDANSKALEAEDMIFKRGTYIQDMASFLTAKGWDVENLTESQLEQARSHAIKEAKHATFQDASAFASWLAKQERKNKVTKVAIGGLMPFKGVPVNIAKMGFELSPAGVVKAVYDGATKVRTGEMEVSDMIDHLTRGMTGTAIAGLGYFLAAQGVLTAGAGDDEKENDFEMAQGGQNYALDLGDFSYTLDWAAPSAIPLFLGAEYWNARNRMGQSGEGTEGNEEGEEDGKQFKEGLEALTRLFDPMLNMTVLSGVSDTLKTVSYSRVNAIFPMAWSIGQNYAGQVVPTLLGQIARTVDDTRRTTYADRDSRVPNGIQKFIQRQENKIPGLSQRNLPWLDVWGREDREENLAVRVLENFLSPGYISRKNTSEMEQELTRLNDLGFEGVLPSKARTSAKVNDKYLTRDQYETLVKTQGGEARSMLEQVIGSPGYHALTDEEKAAYVKKIFDYAKVKGKQAVGDDPEKTPKWIVKLDQAAADHNLQVSALMQASMVIDSTGDADGNDSINTEEAWNVIKDMDGPEALKRAAFDMYNGTSKDYDTYAEEYKVQQVKAEMKAKAEEKMNQILSQLPKDARNALTAAAPDGDVSKFTQAAAYSAIKSLGLSAKEEKLGYEGIAAVTGWTTEWDAVSKTQAQAEKTREQYKKYLPDVSDERLEEVNITIQAYGGYNVSLTRFAETMTAAGVPKAEWPGWYAIYQVNRGNPWKSSYVENAKKKGW